MARLREIIGTYRFRVRGRAYIWRPRAWELALAIMAGCAALYLMACTAVALWG